MTCVSDSPGIRSRAVIQPSDLRSLCPLVFPFCPGPQLPVLTGRPCRLRAHPRDWVRGGRCPRGVPQHPPDTCGSQVWYSKQDGKLCQAGRACRRNSEMGLLGRSHRGNSLKCTACIQTSLRRQTSTCKIMPCPQQPCDEPLGKTPSLEHNCSSIIKTHFLCVRLSRDPHPHFPTVPPC